MVCLVHALVPQDSLPATTYHQVQVSSEYGRSSAKNTYQDKYRFLKVQSCTLPALGKYRTRGRSSPNAGKQVTYMVGPWSGQRVMIDPGRSMRDGQADDLQLEPR